MTHSVAPRKNPEFLSKINLTDKRNSYNPHLQKKSAAWSISFLYTEESPESTKNFLNLLWQWPAFRVSGSFCSSRFPARAAIGIAIGIAICYIISIHASREGSDRFYPWACPVFSYFNPRFPRGKRLFPCASCKLRKRMPNDRHIAPGHFLYYTIFYSSLLSFSVHIKSKVPWKHKNFLKSPKSQAGAQGGPVLRFSGSFLFRFHFSAGW